MQANIVANHRATLNGALALNPKLAVVVLIAVIAVLNPVVSLWSVTSIDVDMIVEFGITNDVHTRTRYGLSLSRKILEWTLSSATVIMLD